MSKKDASAQAATTRRLARWVACVLIVAAPLALGGTLPSVQVILAAAVLLSLSLTAYVSYARGGMSLPWPLWGPFILVFWAGLQLVPLPPSLVAALSPRADAVYAFTLTDLGAYGAGQWRPLSLDPPSTWLALFLQLSFAAMAWTTANLGRRARTSLERAFLIGTILVASIGLLHALAGADRIFGLYEPADGVDLGTYFSTFVNPNTFAGYLAFGAIIGMGVASRERRGRTQTLGIVAAAIATPGVVLTGSRGGQIALVIGVLAFLAMAYAPGDEEKSSARSRARAIGLGATGLSVFGLGLAMLLQRDWRETSWSGLEEESKFSALEAALRYASDFWLVGSGRGTFGVVYPSYQELHLPRTVSHPENILLQLTTEWGLLGAAVALGFGVLGWLWMVAAENRRAKPAHWGVVAALAAVGVQQMVDFGLEAAGLALPVAAAVGITVRAAADNRPDAPHLGRYRWLSHTALVGGLALALLVAFKGPAVLPELPDASVARVKDAPTVEEATRAAKAAFVRHPSDHAVALSAATRLLEGGPEQLGEMLWWINRAMFLAPHDGRPHVVAARGLAAAGKRSQAAVEYRLAIAEMPWMRSPLVREVVDQLREPALLVSATPPDPSVRRLIVGTLMSLGDRKRTHETLELLSDAHPDAPELAYLRGKACARDRRTACARAEGERLLALGERLLGHTVLAQSAAWSGDHAAARRHLAEAPAAAMRDREFQTAAAEVYTVLGDLEAARAAAEEVWRISAAHADAAIQALILRGTIESRIGDPRQALAAYESVYREQRSPLNALRVVHALEKNGQHVEARRQLRAAIQEFPNAPRLRQALQKPAPEGAGGTGAVD